MLAIILQENVNNIHNYIRRVITVVFQIMGWIVPQCSPGGWKSRRAVAAKSQCWKPQKNPGNASSWGWRLRCLLEREWFILRGWRTRILLSVVDDGRWWKHTFPRRDKFAHLASSPVGEESRVHAGNSPAFYSVCTPDCETAMPTFWVSIFSLILLTHVPTNLKTPSETYSINFTNFIDTFQSSKQPNLTSILRYYSYISNLLHHSALWKDYILKVNPSLFKVPMKVDILFIYNSLDSEMQWWKSSLPISLLRVTEMWLNNWNVTLVLYTVLYLRLALNSWIVLGAFSS